VKTRVTKDTEELVHLRIICVKPPNPELFGAEFGLQDNSTTTDWIIHRGETRRNGDILFKCECRVKTGTKGVNFLGAFVHGPKENRFLYLSWKPKGWRPGQSEQAWVRRMKIQLNTITPTQIEEALRSKRPLQAAVAGTAGDGGPNCGSVSLIDGWAVAKLD
jgi:hypothetical protein